MSFPLILVVVARAYESAALTAHSREMDTTTPVAGWPSGIAHFAAGSAHVVVSDVGVVPNAIAATAALACGTYAAVVSAGIAGAFPGRGAGPGDLVIATSSVLADLGAETNGQHSDGAAEGWPDRVEVSPFLAEAVTANLPAARGTILATSKQTDSETSVAAVMRRFPDAVAEAMEGAAVGLAAHAFATPFIEARGISNVVGIADRTKWRRTDALVALEGVLPAVLGALRSHSTTL